MKKRIKQIEEEQLENKLKEIERMKDDSTRCYAALRDLKNKRKQKPLNVKNDKGEVASSEEEQIKLISDHFKKMLAPENQTGNYKEYEPRKMKIPFTTEEVRNAAKSLKNGKSAGSDNLHVEMIKYAPIEIHKEIADIFNKVAETGENINELILGILRPLQKPGKEKGPVINLRPIILLSVPDKILTIYIYDKKNMESQLTSAADWLWEGWL